MYVKLEMTRKKVVMVLGATFMEFDGCIEENIEVKKVSDGY
jgi:hypothetical protein